jgi:Domain of unknown function (DUF4276)
MRLLSSALYCEGPSDALFLRPLLLRLCEATAADAQEPVEVPDVIDLGDEPQHRSRPRDERIALAARAAEGAWVVLFIHADADGRDARTALAQRVQPAIERLALELGTNRQAVAVVPIRMTEAWLLADVDAFRSVLGTTLDLDALGLGDAIAHGVERVADPKSQVRHAIALAKPRARAAQVASYRARLGEAVSLDRLRQLVAFRTLEHDFRAALATLGILRARS